ncbi:hypothetical protein F5Y16DRAFT_411241 [Xylariaceae sp. FL0255]|nr:hypothetical protein F5Y16DRAFT_411241 [Xylariaceae sp. FL0255]
MQGSLSYTVIASGITLTKTIVSFRVPEQTLGTNLDKLAHIIHGDVVPQATCHGSVGTSGELGKGGPLSVCTMPYLPGKSYLEVKSAYGDLSPVELEKQMAFNKHLARYFGRAWLNPQHVEPSQLEQQKGFVLEKLHVLEDHPGFGFLKPHIRELRSESGLATLYSPQTRQVINHMDLSQTNILSRAKIGPFGLDFKFLRLLNGNANHLGWTDFKDRKALLQCFWDEFWTVTGVSDEAEREDIRRIAVLGAKLDTILGYSFCCTLGGETLDEVSAHPASYLRYWLTPLSWDELVLGRLKKYQVFYYA